MGSNKPADDQPGRRSRFQIALDLATVALLIVAAWTLLQRTRGGTAPEAAAPARASAVSQVREVEAEDVHGRTVRLFAHDDSRPRLLFVFRSDCPACATQKRRWAELAESASARGISVVALTAERLEGAPAAYFAEDPVRVLRVKDRLRIPAALGTRTVPTTMLISGDRDVLFRAVGLMHGAALDSLRHRIGRIAREGRINRGSTSVRLRPE